MPDLIPESGWYNEGGPDDDVVVSTRTRIARNLSGYRYPSQMDPDEEETVRSKVLNTVDRAYEDSGAFICSAVGDIAPVDRRLLLERNFIPQEFTIRTEKGIALRFDQRLSALVNDVDHVRIAAIRGGKQVSQTWSDAEAMDDVLEERLDYAVSFDFGYLNAEPTNCGTGLRVSTMLHLPALVETGLIEKALKTVVKAGIAVKGFFGDDEHSLGEMYQISNQATIGESEPDIMEKLDTITDQLVHYERKAREDLAEKRHVETEDRVFRALGILKNCRMLPAKEAIRHLSSLRLGVSYNWIAIPRERVTELFFTTQKAHVQRTLEDGETAGDARLIDFTRARIVRDSLASAFGEGQDV